jgi:urease accessory protein
VALVQTIAGPLAGDRSLLRLDVGPGAALELQNVAATLALPHAEPVQQRVVCHLGRGARLVWLAAPLVLSAGCDVERTLELELEDDARALLGEEVILGRHGERGGRLRGRLRAELGGRPLLHEEVLIDPDDPVTASPLVLGDARAYGSLSLLGAEPPSPADAGELRLAGPGVTVRVTAAEAAALTARLRPVAEALRRALDDPSDAAVPPRPSTPGAPRR